MGSTFNPQILVEKLTKLNNSQQSIETLSHWCIFHMNKSKLVVDTWDRQFHCSPREQRLAFLYLANDILQNSRRKGLEFVAEFWKVLPDALRDVISNGDEFGRNAARRLIGIWEERKVFGSKGQILKEEFLGRQLENSSRNEKQSGFKLRQSAGNSVDKIVSCYQVLYGELDEDAILNKYHNAISSLEKVDKEIVGDISSGQCIGILEELQGQHAILRDCTEELKTVESSRASLVSHLREALQEQEFKLDQTRHQLQASQSRSDHVADLCQQLLKVADIQLYSEDCTKEVHARTASHGLLPPEGERSASSHVEEDPRKATAAAVAAKLTASTSSAQMLSFVLSSLASEGVIGDSTAESSGDYPSDKRPKIDNDQPYVPSQNPQPPMPSYPHPESLHHTSKNEPPPPPSSSPPPLPPLPPVPPYPASQFMQSAGIMSGVPYSYGMTLPPPPPPSLPGYPTVTGMSPFAAPPTNHYQYFQGSQGGFYGQASSLPMAPQ